jgi:hypothetical protein
MSILADIIIIAAGFLFVRPSGRIQGYTITDQRRIQAKGTICTHR